MENVKLNFAHICDYASFGEGGKLNILGIFKNINAAKFPVIHPQMFIVANILVDTAGTYKEIIKLVREEDGIEIITPFEFNITANKANAELGVFGQINAVKFDKEGIYKFKIYVNDNLIKEISLIVNKINK
jgi:hypothetical protein